MPAFAERVSARSRLLGVARDCSITMTKVKLFMFRLRIGTIEDKNFLADSAIRMCRETNDGEFEHARVCAGVEKIFANSERGFYVIAEVNGAPAGSLQVSPCWLDLVSGCFWWIQCLYVLPDYRSQGCYRAMYRFVEELAAANPDVAGFRGIAHPENAHALAVYEKMGVERASYVFYQVKFPLR